MEERASASPETLSSQEYWDRVLKDAKLPRVNRSKDYYITMNFVDSVLGKEGKKTFMEIGAGSSGWLPYFAQKYGYIVSGLDYSEIGCKLAKENLKLLGIKYDEIICQDIFKWDSPKKYDVIFSYGVVEHFEHPEKLISICYDHLNPDGIIITLVPNLTGLSGTLLERFIPDIYKIHKVISKDELRAIHLAAGFTNLKTGYAGTFSLAVVPWIRSNHILFRQGSLQRRISLFGVKACNRIFTAFDRLLGMDLASRYGSPYVISIMRKS